MGCGIPEVFSVSSGAVVAQRSFGYSYVTATGQQEVHPHANGNPAISIPGQRASGCGVFQKGSAVDFNSTFLDRSSCMESYLVMRRLRSSQMVALQSELTPTTEPPMPSSR